MNEIVQPNRRKYMRFELHIPLFAEFALFSVGERALRSRSQKVIVNNISFGGCRFSTHLQIPPRDDVRWCLKVDLGRSTMSLKGVIVHVEEAEGLHQYGVRWELSNYERHCFEYKLNEYLMTVYTFSPHIQSLYKQVIARYPEQHFQKLDFKS
ncbi:MAG: PilZ domain-containing protein [Candidatus Cohnella colombiensis]|uniref:PilZ domain-containing protein n=1 Tax=Candidatus Cohnella colombiensis TaxID=3121368 RepID=A0AA95EXW0_9BACL|nr:MAG: PilZ domain-containing protein [Cohnella sp.]